MLPSIFEPTLHVELFFFVLENTTRILTEISEMCYYYTV